MRYWRDYTLGRAQHTVTGTLLMRAALGSPQLANRRSIYVLLPPSYAGGARRYPVLYMHDGQNLFDQALSYAGEWQVDETMALLAQRGVEAIVVGVANHGRQRLDEYSPFVSARIGAGGRGDAYLDFLVETLKPLIDRDFRTLPGRAHTGILGSSMGGLISLYAFFRHPQVFGFVGAMSPSLWFAEDAIFAHVAAAPPVSGRVYLDVGTYEDDDIRLKRVLPPGSVGQYTLAMRRMRDLLLARGDRAGSDLAYVEEPEGIHHESAWARRLPYALSFLLAPPAQEP